MANPPLPQPPHQPPLVREEAYPPPPPAPSPGVLEDEAVLGVPDDDEGMAAPIRSGLLLRDHPVASLRGFRPSAFQPALMADAARVQDSHLVQGHVHVGDR